MDPLDPARANLVATYRKKAKRYDLTSRFAPVPGYPIHSQRRRAIGSLALSRGGCVVDIGCGTGANFALLEQAVGPTGRIIGVDLTDAMVAQARLRARAHDWRNISLVNAAAADFEFPGDVGGIIATYAHCLQPDPQRVVARGAAALASGGRLVVLDLKLPDHTPEWLIQRAPSAVTRSAALRDWAVRRPWEQVRCAIENGLCEASWTELFFGTAYLAIGVRT